MIEFKIKEGLFNYKIKYFCNEPQYSDALKFIKYMQTKCKDNIVGFKREEFFTKIIDLTKTPDELLAQCKKNTQYEIKRAEKENIKFEVIEDIGSFIRFFNLFAKSKGMSLLKESRIACFKDNLIVSKAVFEDTALTMHSYISDWVIKRVRLFHSASLFRDVDDGQRRNLVGRANRFLHYNDMLYFKRLGFEIYDMGGYAYNTDDVELKRINEFKDSFGGELMEESHYFSYPFYIFQKLKHILTGG